ncbi:hypothetical protein BYT27DRAFT_7143065 [Phlegmacium glaucopus]|nr:hypothetical protein BYT27DRAFT_7143065 [Phlegmacium glaucopus]
MNRCANSGIGMATIGDMPFEILSEIFKWLYVGSQGPEHTSEERVCDLRSPTLFPFAPALVCHFWCGILAYSPHYWDKLVLYADEDPPALIDALSWSKDRPLDILVASRISDMTEGGKLLENERMEFIINALMPHIHRCRRISFEVLYASSLPSLSSIFKQNPVDLVDLTFEIRFDDVQEPLPFPNSPDTSCLSNTFFPKLERLSINGRAFMDLGRLHPDLLKRLPADIELGISQFTFSEEVDDGYTVAEFIKYIKSMGGIYKLRLNKFDIPAEPLQETRQGVILDPHCLYLKVLRSAVLP